MRRRDVIAALAAAAGLRPVATRAQQPSRPIIGVLSGVTKEGTLVSLEIFRKGLLDVGVTPDRDATLVIHSADEPKPLRALADELVNDRVSVIAAINGTAASVAAKSATTSIPVVFMMGADPVKIGLVSSINHPGGNVTGVSFLINTLNAKRLGILHELVPKARRVGLLVNPGNPSAAEDSKDMTIAASSLGLDLEIVKASSDGELTEAFATLARLKCDALVVSPDAFFSGRSAAIVRLVEQNALPAVYNLRSYADAGGLASYGTDVNEAIRQVARYVGRILKGEKPGDLPVMMTDKFEFVLNAKTAKALGLTFSSGLISIADDVIE